MSLHSFSLSSEFELTRSHFVAPRTGSFTNMTEFSIESTPRTRNLFKLSTAFVTTLRLPTTLSSKISLPKIAPKSSLPTALSRCLWLLVDLSTLGTSFSLERETSSSWTSEKVDPSVSRSPGQIPSLHDLTNANFPLTDYPSVNENAADPPLENEKDTLNSPSALSLEATYINQNFAFQVVREDPSTRVELDHPNPFYSTEETEPLASCGFRYRKFDLSVTEDEDVGIVVRTEVDAFVKAASAQEEDSYVTIKTLNEFDSRAQGSGGAPDWRTKLDTQRGAVVATEMKNNSSKLARWAVQSVLAGADQLKIG